MLALCSPYQLVDFADCHDDRVDSTVDGRPLISGGPANAVLARILSTLLVKFFARPYYVCGNRETVGGFVTLFILNHNCRDGATGPRKKFDDIFNRLDTIHNVTDGRTDRQTDTEPQQRPCLRIASRGKNGETVGLTVTVPYPFRGSR